MWLSINEHDTRPIYLQIINQIKEQVCSGALKTGDELPSVRELAESLSINLHTVRAAYLKLRDQGIIDLHLGRRATIARLRPASDPTAEDENLESRLEEVITDARLKGLLPAAIRRMVERLLNDKKEG